MVRIINGKIIGEDKIENNFIGVINTVGMFTSVTTEERLLLYILFNPGPTIKISVENANVIPKGKTLKKLIGFLTENEEKREIEGKISENGIFITVFGEGRSPEYILFNPDITEVIDPCWFCAHTEYKKNKMK